MPTGEFPVEELALCPAYDQAALTTMRDVLLTARADDGTSSSYIQFDKSGSIVLAVGPELTESFAEIADKIREYQRERQSLIDTLALHAAIVPFQIEPLWHAENFSDAFVTSTDAATEGLSGTVPGNTPIEVARFIVKHIKTDPEFEDLPSVAIVRPSVGSLLHIRLGAFHRSPTPTEMTPAEKLIVNAAITRSFR